MSASVSEIRNDSSSQVETEPWGLRRREDLEVAYLCHVLRGNHRLTRYELWREGADYPWASVGDYDRALEAGISQGCIRAFGSQLVEAVEPTDQAAY
jgi:hypothetical protein